MTQSNDDTNELKFIPFIGLKSIDLWAYEQKKMF